MDWSSCTICGSHKGEPLKCPVDSRHKDFEQVYTAFLQNVKQFKELHALRVNLEFGPEVTAELLAESRASWHKSCHFGSFPIQNLNVQETKGKVMFLKTKPRPELRGSF